MPRKPFSEVTESYFRNEMREPLVRGHDNRSAACLLANAAIAQDREYALRRIREENHEGMIYYRERDEARAERDALRADNARQAEEWRKARVENCALREENERLKAQVGAEQLDADRVRTASRELEVEVERLKERLEKSEARRTHWDAVTLTNYEFTKTQLAEAVTQIHELMNSHFNLYKSTFGEDRDPNDDLVRIKARDFLVKAKS